MKRTLVLKAKALENVFALATLP